jgi:hypothetical protein
MRSKGGHRETKNISRARKIVVNAPAGKNLCDINSFGMQKIQKHSKTALAAKNGDNHPLGRFVAAARDSFPGSAWERTAPEAQPRYILTTKKIANLG